MYWNLLKNAKNIRWKVFVLSFFDEFWTLTFKFFWYLNFFEKTYFLVSSFCQKLAFFNWNPKTKIPPKFSVSRIEIACEIPKDFRSGYSGISGFRFSRGFGISVFPEFWNFGLPRISNFTFPGISKFQFPGILGSRLRNPICNRFLLALSSRTRCTTRCFFEFPFEDNSSLLFVSNLARNFFEKTLFIPIVKQ